MHVTLIGDGIVPCVAAIFVVPTKTFCVTQYETFCHNVSAAVALWCMEYGAGAPSARLAHN